MKFKSLFMKKPVRILLLCAAIFLAAVIGDVIDIVHLIDLFVTNTAKFFSENAILIKSITAISAAVIAAFAAIYGVKSVNEQKSFELLTKQRLDTFNSLKTAFAELRLLSSNSSLDAVKKANNCDAHLLEIEKIVCQIKSLLSGTETHEFYLVKEIEKLQDDIKEHLNCEVTDTNSLKSQTKVVFTFVDIYLWALWNYVQNLYKEKDRGKRAKLFNDEFYNNYDRAEKLNDKLKKEKSAFFARYPKGVFKEDPRDK